jgi:hypothetical protein
MLGHEMVRLINFLQDNHDLDHCDLCNLAATEFKLFDTDERFPI